MSKRKCQIQIIIFFASVFLSLVFPDSSFALTRRKLPGKKITISNSSTVGTSVRFRHDRRAVIVSFSHLDLANSVTYVLTYLANGKSEGSQGMIRPAGEIATSREILFGTCSTNVCTYHINITNARLTITIALKSGKTVRRSYRLKI